MKTAPKECPGCGSRLSHIEWEYGCGSEWDSSTGEFVQRMECRLMQDNKELRKRLLVLASYWKEEGKAWGALRSMEAITSSRILAEVADKIEEALQQ